MDKINKAQALNQIAAQEVPDSLDLWPQIEAKAALTTPARAIVVPRQHFGSRRLVGVLSMAAVVLLAIALGSASLLWGSTPGVSAQSILARAQSASGTEETVSTYHLQMSSQLIAEGNQTVSTEVWYADTTHQRTESVTKNVSGTVVLAESAILTGDEAWIARTTNGETRVVHTVGTVWTPADEPAQNNSLSDLLAQYSNNKMCMDAALQSSDETILGRAAYLIALTPKATGCGDNPAEGKLQEATPSATDVALQDAKKAEVGQESGQGGKQATDPGAKQTQGNAKSASSDPTKNISILLWIDKVSFLPLKSESRDGAGTVTDSTEVTNVEYDLAIPATTFAYTPPAGAIVTDFTGGNGSDIKAALLGNNGTPDDK